MIYNGFVVTDTRDNTGTESNYADTPTYGPSPSPSANAPLPGLGGSSGSGTSGWNNPPANGSSSSKGNWAQWITPETVNATLQLAGGITNLVAENKKDKNQPIQQQPVPQYYMPPAQPTGMSTTAKVLIGVGILIFLIMIIVLAIYMSKPKTAGK